MLLFYFYTKLYFNINISYFIKMSSKEKKNFDFDKKIPQSKKINEEANEQNAQDAPIEPKEEETNNAEPPQNEGGTFTLTQVGKEEKKFIYEREEYLKSKLDKLPVPDTVIKGVTKGIHKTNLSIHDDIANNNLLFADHSRQISEILEKSLNKSKISSSNSDIYAKYSPEVIAFKAGRRKYSNQYTQTRAERKAVRERKRKRDKEQYH